MTTRGYLGQVYEVRPVLAAMESRGLPIDDAERRSLDAEFDRAQRELGREIAALAPIECRRVHPKQGYKGVPPEVRAALKAMGAEWEADVGVGPMAVAYVETLSFTDPGDDGESYRYAQRTFAVAVEDAATGAPVSVPTLRWCRVYDFNANSSQQMLDYIRAKGHPVPKDKHRENADGEPAETTAAKELLRLAAKTGDTFYLKVVEYRGLSKLRGTYVDGFVPGPDGCVHTSFTFDTGIGQLSSRNPNIQNFPKLKPTPALAKAMRRMVAARPGHIITEWDFKSCHVITLGFLAEDLNYMRLGRLDIHSFVAGHFLGHWDGRAAFAWPDEKLRAEFKWLKSDAERKRVRDDQAKHGILGIGNGLKAKGLYERYMESFPPTECVTCGGRGWVPGARASTTKRCPACKGMKVQSGQRTAEVVLEVCGELFPRVFEYQKAEARRAHDQQFLKTPFGHIRRFYEVFRWDARKSDYAPGDQHEQAVAFRLANIAFGHIREKLKALDRAGLAERYGLFNNVHDSFMFHFPAEQLEQHVAEVWPVLVAPSTVLRHPTICPDGLVIDVEASYGTNWAEMHEINLSAAAAPVLPSPTPTEALT